MNFQIVNTLTPSAVHNTCVFFCFEAGDSITNLHVSLVTQTVEEMLDDHDKFEKAGRDSRNVKELYITIAFQSPFLTFHYSRYSTNTEQTTVTLITECPPNIRCAYRDCISCRGSFSKPLVSWKRLATSLTLSWPVTYVLKPHTAPTRCTWTSFEHLPRPELTLTQLDSHSLCLSRYIHHFGSDEPSDTGTTASPG